MPITFAGRDHVVATLRGESATPFDGSNARLGVGNSADPFSAEQTDLQASSNKVRSGMQSGYPVRSGNILTYRAIFGPDMANWTWREWGLFNAAGGGTMLNREIQTLGTKTDAQTWALTVSIEIEIV